MNHRHYFDKPLQYVGAGKETRLSPVGIAAIISGAKWVPTMLDPAEHDHIGGDVPHLHATTTSEPVPTPAPAKEASS